MTPTAPVPDALMIPERYKRGTTLAARVDSICEIANALLRVDEGRGERAFIRRQPPSCFVTKDRADTINFPLNTPFRGRPRYRWVDRPDGIRLGYLVPEARELVAPAFDPIALGLHLTAF